MDTRKFQNLWITLGVLLDQVRNRKSIGTAVNLLITTLRELQASVEKMRGTVKNCYPGATALTASWERGTEKTLLKMSYDISARVFMKACGRLWIQLEKVL